MSRLNIVHLVDDATAGGVMRMLTHLIQHPELSANADQRIQKVNRQALSLGRIEADVIVSHLTVSWRGLPALVTLRAMHPSARLLHVEHSYTRGFTALNVTAKRRFCALLRVAYSLFDEVVAVSNTQADWMRSRALVTAEALRVIEPQVDLSGFLDLPAPARPVRVIGAIGRLERQKGFDVLIEAFRKTTHPEARLMIFGEGSERARLEEIAQGDSRIVFRGHAGDPVAAFAEVDAVALPSRWEAFGIVAREAIAAGRPTLVATVDGLADLGPDEAVQVKGLHIPQWTRALEDAFGGRIAAPVRTHCVRAARTYANDWNTAFRGAPASGRKTEMSRNTPSLSAV